MWVELDVIDMLPLPRWLCVCVCPHVCLCVCVRMYVCVSGHECVFVCVFSDTMLYDVGSVLEQLNPGQCHSSTLGGTYPWEPCLWRGNTHSHTFTHIHTHSHTFTHIHTNIHTHTHTHTHTHHPSSSSYVVFNKRKWGRGRQRGTRAGQSACECYPEWLFIHQQVTRGLPQGPSPGAFPRPEACCWGWRPSLLSGGLPGDLVLATSSPACTETGSSAHSPPAISIWECPRGVLCAALNETVFRTKPSWERLLQRNAIKGTSHLSQQMANQTVGH